jgi:hypothetical protein
VTITKKRRRALNAIRVTFKVNFWEGSKARQWKTTQGSYSSRAAWNDCSKPLVMLEKQSIPKITLSKEEDLPKTLLWHRIELPY